MYHIGIVIDILKKIFPFGWRDYGEYIGAIIVILLVVDNDLFRLYLLLLLALIYGREVYAYNSGKVVWKLQPVQKKTDKSL